MDLIPKSIPLISRHMGTQRNLFQENKTKYSEGGEERCGREQADPESDERDAENIQGGEMDAKSGCDLPRD